jgi:Zn-dependent peptidase ImmA (M78 family)
MLISNVEFEFQPTDAMVKLVEAVAEKVDTTGLLIQQTKVWKVEGHYWTGEKRIAISSDHINAEIILAHELGHFICDTADPISELRYHMDSGYCSQVEQEADEVANELFKACGRTDYYTAVSILRDEIKKERLCTR